jgi:hypothetical protein
MWWSAQLRLFAPTECPGDRKPVQLGLNGIRFLQCDWNRTKSFVHFISHIVGLLAWSNDQKNRRRRSDFQRIHETRPLFRTLEMYPRYPKSRDNSENNYKSRIQNPTFWKRYRFEWPSGQIAVCFCAHRFTEEGLVPQEAIHLGSIEKCWNIWRRSPKISIESMPCISQSGIFIRLLTSSPTARRQAESNRWSISRPPVVHPALRMGIRIYWPLTTHGSSCWQIMKWSACQMEMRFSIGRSTWLRDRNWCEHLSGISMDRKLLRPCQRERCSWLPPISKCLKYSHRDRCSAWKEK